MPDRTFTLADLFGLKEAPKTGKAGRLAERVLTGAEKKRVETELKSVPEVTRAAAQSEIARAVRGLLDIPVPEVLARGWRTLDALRKVAAESRENPGERFDLALGGHEVASRHEPALEISVNGQTVATIPAEISVAFEVDSAVLVIRDGHIGAVEAAAFQAQGTLRCRGAEIASVRTEKLRLPAAAVLEPPLEIPA